MPTLSAISRQGPGGKSSAVGLLMTLPNTMNSAISLLNIGTAMPVLMIIIADRRPILT